MKTLSLFVVSLFDFNLSYTIGDITISTSNSYVFHHLDKNKSQNSKQKIVVQENVNKPENTKISTLTECQYEITSRCSKASIFVLWSNLSQQLAMNSQRT
jgi:hypothetical protein